MYNPDKKRQGAPAFSFGKGRYDEKGGFNVGPGSYNTDLKSYGPGGVKFGNAGSRSDGNLKTPGPGAYELYGGRSSVDGAGHRFGMSSSARHKDSNPGPG
jgi:hypothetical protein